MVDAAAPPAEATVSAWAVLRRKKLSKGILFSLFAEISIYRWKIAQGSVDNLLFAASNAAKLLNQSTSNPMAVLTWFNFLAVGFAVAVADWNPGVIGQRHHVIDKAIHSLSHLARMGVGRPEYVDNNVV